MDKTFMNGKPFKENAFDEFFKLESKFPFGELDFEFF